MCAATFVGWMIAAAVALSPLLGGSSSGLPGPLAGAWASGGAAWALLLATHGLALGLVLADLWRMPRLSRRRKLLWAAGLAGTGPVAMSLYWALHVRGLHRPARERSWPHAEFMPSGHPVAQED